MPTSDQVRTCDIEKTLQKRAKAIKNHRQRFKSACGKDIAKESPSNQEQKRASHMDNVRHDTKNTSVTAPMLTQREAASPTTPIGGGA